MRVHAWILYIYMEIISLSVSLCNRVSESRAGGAGALVRVQSVVRSRDVTCRGRAGVGRARV